MTNGRRVSRLLAASLTSAAVFGQDFSGQSPAGFDLSGYYINLFQQDPVFGTAAGPLVDWGGIPINDAGRLYGLAWDSSRITVRQQQCPGYTPPYIFYAPQNYRIWEERDPVTQKLIAIQTYGQTSEALHTIWMDGRPHPPAYALHTFSGFSTGKWEGNILTTFTTHIKRGWNRATGMPQSYEATVVEHFILHGDRITYASVTYDPVYLAEPWVKTLELIRRELDPNAWLYACDDGEEILDKTEDRVPSYLWGQHPYLREASDKNHVPLLGSLGGADTMHPEFAAKLKDLPAAEAAAQKELVPIPGAPQQSSKAVDPDPHDGEIHPWLVQGNLYMLVGDGGNIAVQAGPQGALVVDTGTGRLADKVIAAIRKILPDPTKPIQFIVNTSFHADHVGGNVKLRAAGTDPSVVGSFFSGGFADAGKGSTIMAHQNTVNHMSAPTGKVAPTPTEGWPSDTYLDGRRRKYYNGEAVELFWEPNAVTDGDSIVQFRRSDVIVTGDIFDTTRYPFIDVANGGSIQGEIDALDNILNKTVYQHEGEGGTLIIPGHGHVCDEFEVSEYRDMLVIFRDRIAAMIKNNATLAQVKAARLTADYDTRFGATSGSWTTDMFVEAIYTSLKNPAKPAKRN